MSGHVRGPVASIRTDLALRFCFYLLQSAANSIILKLPMNYISLLVETKYIKK